MKQYSIKSQDDLNEARSWLRKNNKKLFDTIDNYIRDYKQLRDACKAIG